LPPMSQSTTTTPQLEQVSAFWNANLCGSHFIDTEIYTEKFFEDYRELRYRKTHHLLSVIDWEEARGKKLLEVGLGVGADATMWARHGAIYTGIDLTEEASFATNKHFDYLGLQGTIEQGNAESMRFEDNSFDMVYSHGVLHHSPSIEKTFAEIHRTLKPGGKFIVMLYAKGSFNYWVRIQLWFRLKLIFTILKSKFGIEPKAKLWKEHLANFKSIGWSYLSWKNFPHRCTDGAGCEIANIYYKSEVKELLEKGGFKFKRSMKAHFPIGGKFPKFERLISKYLGFHLIAWAENVK